MPNQSPYFYCSGSKDEKAQKGADLLSSRLGFSGTTPMSLRPNFRTKKRTTKQKHHRSHPTSASRRVCLAPQYVFAKCFTAGLHPPPISDSPPNYSPPPPPPPPPFANTLCRPFAVPALAGRQDLKEETAGRWPRRDFGQYISCAISNETKGQRHAGAVTDP